MLDTSIYIAQAQGNFPEVMDGILEKIKLGKIVLLTNEIIQQEWKRHEEEVRRGIYSRIQKEMSAGKRIAHFIPEASRAAFEKTISDFQNSVEEQKRAVDELIEKTNHLLFEHAKVIPITDGMRIRVTKLAVDKKAPFIHKASSVADALIFLSTIEFLKMQMEGDDYEGAIFVTANYVDFSKSEKEKDLLHEDLLPLAKQVGLKFSLRITEVIQLADEIEKELEAYIQSLIDYETHQQIDIMRGK